MRAAKARGIRFGIIAARTPSMWPVITFMPWTRKAFDREFKRESARFRIWASF